MSQPAAGKRHWLFSLWPLLLLFIALAAGAQLVWQYWPQLLIQSVVWQKELHQQMAALLQQVKAAPQQAGVALMLFSLSYGVLHALGPGHGKVVIATYLATHPARLKSSLKLTFAASLLQGLVAIGLVTLVLVVLQLSSRQLHQSSFWLEKGSFILVMLLGVLLTWRALKRLYLTVKAMWPVPALRINSLQPLSQDHVHSANCGCGHRHLPSDAELQAGGDWRTRTAIVLAMGMRPCSGAILVLLFSKVIGVFIWGMLSALAMALGTSLTISALALFVHYSRKLAVRLSGRRAPSAWGAVAWGSLALMGGLILLFAGVLMYVGAQPEFGGVIRPFTR